MKYDDANFSNIVKCSVPRLLRTIDLKCKFQLIASPTFIFFIRLNITKVTFVTFYW